MIRKDKANVINCKDCDGYEAGYSAGLNDAERPKGEWIHRDARLDTCSNCGLGFKDLCLDGFNFCPNCGADMRKGDVENG